MPYADPEVNKAYQKQYQATWSKNNPDKIARAQKKYREENRELLNSRKMKKYTTDERYDMQLKNKFGITIEQYYEMFSSQNGKCAICRRTSEKRLAVDHCHFSGKIRALLCDLCNRGLGFFRDDRLSLSNAVEYLTIHEVDWLDEK